MARNLPPERNDDNSMLSTFRHSKLTLLNQVNINVKMAKRGC